MRTISGALTTTDWTTWEDIRTQLGKDQCIWIDLTGAHHGPAPTHHPVATHLWSWRPHRWTRVRIDGHRVLAAVLTEHDTTNNSRIDREYVTATTTKGIPWGRHQRAARWEEKVTLIVTGGAHPITFADISPIP